MRKLMAVGKITAKSPHGKHRLLLEAMIYTGSSEIKYRFLKAVPPSFHPTTWIGFSNLGPGNAASRMETCQDNMLLVRARANSPTSMAFVGNKSIWVNIPSTDTSTFAPRFTILAAVRHSKVPKISKDAEGRSFPDHARGRVLKATWDFITPAQPDD
jgi:hypothetical protein